VLEHVLAAQIPVILAVNKVDLVRPKSALLPYLAACEKRAAFQAIVPISAANADNLDRLTDLITDLLPVGPPLYPLDATTDRSMEFRIAEMIREKLLIALRQEVPYGRAGDPGTRAEARRRAGRRRDLGRPRLPSASSSRGRCHDQEWARPPGSSREDLRSPLLPGDPRQVKTNWADNARTLQQFGFESNS
jgi:hypothetical protein